MIPKHLPSVNNKKQLIKEILRVNHAGEYGAKRIYQGQLACVKDAAVREEIEHMLEQELRHLQYFTEQLEQHNIPQTKFQPLWHILGYALGAITAKMGAKAAMACTVAVEEVIEQHYNQQLDALKQYPEEKDLIAKIKQFLQEELEHRDTGIEYEAKEAKGYELIYKFVQMSSRLAIKISSKV